MADRRERGRAAFARQAWTDTYRELSAASTDDLEAADLERLAVAAYLVGKDEESAAAWEAAHRVHVEAAAPAEAARCAFWMAITHLLRGDMAQAGGWLSRAEGLIGPSGTDCAAAGYLLIPRLLDALDAGDAGAARDLAGQTTAIGERFGDVDLRAFGTLGHGQALVALGETIAGTAKLDEVMVSVTSGEVGPITSGIVYCAVVLECMQLFDLARAWEWTRAFSTWCDAQPDLVPYRGQCLVHRSQLLQASGDWPGATAAVEAACDRLTDPPHPALGLAHYQEAELHRLRGAFDEADAAYRQANSDGCSPMPGLALLALVRSDVEAAVAAINRALHEVQSPAERPAMLAAAVEIYRAVADIPAARLAADELAVIAAASTSQALAASSAQAAGTVLLGEGDPSAALRHLRSAAASWKQLHMPYERARTIVLLGLSCAALGDLTSAALELDAAREAFTALGARPDLERLQALAAGLTPPADRTTGANGSSALSSREREVLAHVATGKTNREIAAELTISQHTVGRHVENIFTKLGVTSRAAATAYAFEHDML